MKTKNGRVLYPTFQFDGDGVRPAVPEILGVFRNVPVDGWTIAAWFTTPAVTLDDTTPVVWLDEGRDLRPVIEVAEDTAARWSAP